MSSATTSRLHGITSMLAAALFFSGMDAILKLFAGHYPPMQVSAMRGAASIPFIVLPLVVTGRLRELRPVRWPLHLVRGALGVGMLVAFVYAVRSLSLANAYAVFLVAPLLIAALSVPFLGEHVDGKRWLAILIGLGGVLVMLRPSATGFISFGALAALAAAVGYSCSAIVSRILLRTDTTVSLVFGFLLSLTVIAGLIALPNWVALRNDDWGWLLGVGLLGALGQHFAIDAFRHAPASVLAPFEYTALLWGALIDWFAWHTLPSANVFVGGGIVVVTGVYLVRRESLAVTTLPASG
jgi:drug/metabolite transporter (DMT)-like permease